MRIVTIVFPPEEKPLAVVLPFETVVKPGEYICWSIHSLNTTIGRVSIQFAKPSDTFFFGSDKSGDYVLQSTTYNPADPTLKLSEAIILGQAPQAAARLDCKYLIIGTNINGANPKVLDPKIIIDGP